MTSLFIGGLVHPSKEYCIDGWLRNIEQLKPKGDIHLVDTGFDREFTKRVESYGLPVSVVPNKNLFESISKGREELIKQFIKGEKKYFLSLECDVFINKEVPEKLISESKKVISVPYILGYMYNQESRLKEDYLLSVNSKSRKYYTLKELQEHADGKSIVEINEAGLGCTLIQRDVIQQYYPKIKHNSHTSDDKRFYEFCRENDISRYTHLDLFSAIKHYPHFHMNYAVNKRTNRSFKERTE